MKNYKRIFLYVFVLVLAQACGGGIESTDNIGSVRISQEMPPSLIRSLGSSMDIGAQVVVDGGTPKNITLNLVEQTVSGIVSDLSSNKHSFDLEFFARESNSIVVLARATIEAEVQANQEILITFLTFHYPDDDLDGFTNLAELVAGTLLTDAGSKPDSDQSASSANYLVFDQAGISITDSSIVVGNVSSANYKDSAN